jgi:hypothetical protein
MVNLMSLADSGGRAADLLVSVNAMKGLPTAICAHGDDTMTISLL